MKREMAYPAIRRAIVVVFIDQSNDSRECLSIISNWMPEIKLPRMPIIPTNSIQSNFLTKYSCPTLEIDKRVAPNRTRTSPRAGFEA
jgi:hypothetical protein